jgi:septal ring factor EnvC (AmiA/AmiB activator)
MNNEIFVAQLRRLKRNEEMNLAEYEYERSRLETMLQRVNTDIETVKHGIAEIQAQIDIHEKEGGK